MLMLLRKHGMHLSTLLIQFKWFERLWVELPNVQVWPEFSSVATLWRIPPNFIFCPGFCLWDYGQQGLVLWSCRRTVFDGFNALSWSLALKRQEHKPTQLNLSPGSPGFIPEERNTPAHPRKGMGKALRILDHPWVVYFSLSRHPTCSNTLPYHPGPQNSSKVPKSGAGFPNGMVIPSSPVATLGDTLIGPSFESKSLLMRYWVKTSICFNEISWRDISPDYNGSSLVGSEKGLTVLKEKMDEVRTTNLNRSGQQWVNLSEGMYIFDQGDSRRFHSIKN